jgi:hypothetical protein
VDDDLAVHLEAAKKLSNSAEHRLEISDAQLFRHSVGIDAVVLVRQRSSSPHVADDHTFDLVDQHVVQPLRLRSFLEGHVHPRPGPHQCRDRLLFRRHGRFHDDPARLVTHAGNHR